MTIAEDLLRPSPEFEDIEYPSGDLESQEPPLESELHLRQLLLLIQTLEYLWKDRQDFYAFGNLTIYYSPNQKKSEYFRGPDFFVVLDTERKPRKSWVVWEEGGKYPHVIVELLSNSTAQVDRTTKKQIYQDIFRTLEYFWFDPNSLEFEGFELVKGQYQTIKPNDKGWFWSEQLQLFLGVYEQKLRFFSLEGVLVPTPEESAQIEKQQREATEQQLEIEQQRNQKLAAKLRELGIDPDSM
ncbi:Uma2 family endonuclease [Limnoraphis robusta]|uniref:Uma2 family endonuclease n=1 Tax=Limnoraphis robusta CCNP1315 TaxID=3110306 RepID=A0ABU5TS44_9CYAN|nr:Uma2 family endonuclease [Limnoraphis robusta]MEA5517733.1 Uma2 family endonuclease [Limnoraphis robusta CCNP1315]MEA5546284.1 Uma2 family endonuclease [Limnoraphis robusta CCNP1324]